MRKYIYYICIIIIVSFGVFVFLLARNRVNTGFQRKIRKEKLVITKVSQLPSASIYFIGFSADEIYLKSLSHKGGNIFSIDYEFNKFKNIDMRLFGPTFQNNAVSISLLDGIIGVADRKVGKITTVDLSNRENHFFNSVTTTIDKSQVISRNRIAGRKVTLKRNEPKRNELNRKLIIVDFLKGKINYTYVLKKQVDGVYDTDGLLKFDPETSKLFYMFFHRGEFLCFDTTLSLQYKAKTVDTVTKASITVTKVDKTAEKKTRSSWIMANPPKPVNRAITIYKKRVYVCSGIKSDNETSSDYEKNQIVDVYSTDNGKYLHSFYIPKYKDKKLQDFKVIDNFIFATYGQYLVKFEIGK